MLKFSSYITVVFCLSFLFSSSFTILQHLTLFSFSLKCLGLSVLFYSTLVISHHWPMDIPECSLLAIQDLPLCLVLLSVDPANRENSYIEFTPLKHELKQHTLDKSGPRIKSLSLSPCHKHTHTQWGIQAVWKNEPHYSQLWCPSQ